MAGMSKRECKKMAAGFARLRPGANAIANAELLWNDMINEAALHIPGNLADAFLSSCRNRGIWMKEYEE